MPDPKPRRGATRSRFRGGEPAPGVEPWVRWSATLSMAAAVAVLSVAATVYDHEPVPFWSLLAGLILAGFGVIAITHAPSWGRALAGMFLGGAAWAIAAAFARNLVLVFYGAPIAAVAVIAGQGLATVILKGLRLRAGALTSLRALGTVALVLSFAPLPYGLMARNATVTVDHSSRGAIAERAFAFHGITLGDTATNVQRIMGAAPRWTPDQDIGPLAGDATHDGPSSLDYGAPRDTFLRYPGASFAIRDGHVRWIQIDDHAVATSSGLGPGDSISLVKRVYPSANCSEDTIHSEPDYIPYPYCQQRMRGRRWLTFFGSYRQPGAPITGVWLSTHPLL